MSKSKERKEDKSEHIPQRNKFKGELKIRQYNWTPNQQKIIDCILDKESKIIFISAPAGSGKSLITTYCGLKLLENKTLSDYLFIRNPLECSDSAGLGYLPGDLETRVEPYMQVLQEKLNELLNGCDIEALKNDNRLHTIVTNYIRGLDWKLKYCHIEEAQGLSWGELKLILTRYGQRSKLVIVGDPNQSDLPIKKQGGFMKFYNIFDNEESRGKGIHCFKLDKTDIKRSDITAYIIDKIEEMEYPKDRSEPMFPQNPL